MKLKRHGQGHVPNNGELTIRLPQPGLLTSMVSTLGKTGDLMELLLRDSQVAVVTARSRRENTVGNLAL